MDTSWAGLNRCSTDRNTNLNNGHLQDCSIDNWQDKMITGRCTAKSASVKPSSVTVPLMIILYWFILTSPRPGLIKTHFSSTQLASRLNKQ